MPDDQAQTSWVWGDDVKAGTCKDDRCGAAITWATFTKSGKKCPFTGELVALRTATDSETGRSKWLVALESSHFATCPGARSYSRTPAPNRQVKAPPPLSIGQAHQARVECETALAALRALYRRDSPPALEETLRRAAEALKRAIEKLGGPSAAANKAGKAVGS